jgi:hypothetical protein
LHGIEGLQASGTATSMPSGRKRSRINSDQVQEDESLKPLQMKSTIAKENVISIRIRDLENSMLFAEV